MTDWADLGGLRRRLPLVCQVHDVWPHGRGLLPLTMERELLKRTYRVAGDLLVYHDVLKDELVDDFGIEPDHVHVIPQAIDASDLRDAGTAGRDRKAVLLFFGTLRQNKGLGVLCDALELLGPQRHAQVIIAGEGSDETKSILSTRLGSMAHVSLEFGYISYPRKHELFNSASWLLLPYTSFHSQSAVLSDAYSYRVPLIVSNVGALGPTVRDDETGIVVVPSDADALAKAMSDAIEGRAPVDDTIMNAAALSRDYAQVGPQLREILDTVATRRRR
jgi:glycosyltransferase involved in cell wall biosynthesis